MTEKKTSNDNEVAEILWVRQLKDEGLNSAQILRRYRGYTSSGDVVIQKCRCNGLTDNEIVEHLQLLDDKAIEIRTALHDKGLTDDEADQVALEFKRYLDRPDIQKYYKVRDVQRHRKKIVIAH